MLEDDRGFYATGTQVKPKAAGCLAGGMNSVLSLSLLRSTSSQHLDK